MRCHTQITFGETLTLVYASNFSAALQHQNATLIFGADPAFIVRLSCASTHCIYTTPGCLFWPYCKLLC